MARKFQIMFVAHIRVLLFSTWWTECDLFTSEKGTWRGGADVHLPNCDRVGWAISLVWILSLGLGWRDWMDCYLTSSRVISSLRPKSIFCGDLKYTCPSWVGGIKKEGFLEGVIKLTLEGWVGTSQVKGSALGKENGIYKGPKRDWWLRKWK